MTIPRASVVIPVYNGAASIERCLGALCVQSRPREEYEIIVVDDGSVDETLSIVRRFPIVVLTQAHRGPAAARNLGTAQARGEIILFTDADTEPAPNWIETMLAPFVDPSVAGAKGTYRTRQREWMARFVQIEYEEKYARMARASKVDVIDTYSAAYRRSVAMLDGGFDESYPSASAEDAEFSFRLAKRGYRLFFVPDAIVFHHHASTLRAYCRRKFKIGYWRVRVHERHPDKLISDAHTPPTLRIQMILAPFLVVTAAGTLVVPQSASLLVVLAAGFVLTTVPLTWRALRQDPLIGVMVPFFVLCRALALGGGAFVGLGSEILRVTRIGRVLASLVGKCRPRLNLG